MKLVLINGFFNLKHDALGVEDNKKGKYCYDVWKVVFTLASQGINAENDITQDNLKAALAEAFSGEEYK